MCVPISFFLQLSFSFERRKRAKNVFQHLLAHFLFTSFFLYSSIVCVCRCRHQRVVAQKRQCERAHAIGLKMPVSAKNARDANGGGLPKNHVFSFFFVSSGTPMRVAPTARRCLLCVDARRTGSIVDRQTIGLPKGKGDACETLCPACRYAPTTTTRTTTRAAGNVCDGTLRLTHACLFAYCAYDDDVRACVRVQCPIFVCLRRGGQTRRAS